MVDELFRRVTQLVTSDNGVTMAGNVGRSKDARVMYQRPLPKQWLDWSQRRLNTLAEVLDAQRYLEIGIFRASTVERVNVRDRVGVDPKPSFNVHQLAPGFTFLAVTSDAYFASLDPAATFDLACLGGLHTFEQTRTDLFNALAHVPSGVILIDDTVPEDEAAAIPDLDATIAKRRETGSTRTFWMGDVWKLVFYLDRFVPELDFRTIVGSGNEQTLVWRRQRGEAIVEQPGNELGELNYREAFAHGVPTQFRPCGEAEALQACLQAVRRQP